jgi:hypothetical protein
MERSGPVWVLYGHPAEHCLEALAAQRDAAQQEASYYRKRADRYARLADSMGYVAQRQARLLDLYLTALRSMAGRLERSPFYVMAGRALARRLYAVADNLERMASEGA